MAKNPFKVGDRVYVYPIGWGTVNLASIDTCEIDFDGDDTKTGDWRVASFTEYDPIKGGLSHERPEAKVSNKIDGKDLVNALSSIEDRAKERFGIPPKTDSGIYFTPEEPSVELNYRRFIDDALNIHDIVGFVIGRETAEVTDKIGGEASHIPTGRVTLSIDLVRRK